MTAAGDGTPVAPAVQPAEKAPEPATPATEATTSPQDAAPAAAPDVPLGNPLDWLVGDWLKAVGIPVDKVAADLAKAGADHPGAAVPAQKLRSIWLTYASPAQVAAALELVLSGLSQLAVTGHGESGHSDAELA